MGDTGTQQAIEFGGWIGDPGEECVEMGLQGRPRGSLEMDALAADRARQHPHRLVTAQLADADRAQPIGPGGKQALMPLVQGGQAQWLVEFAGGSQQHIQQALHLG
jgi:hypothetical protein